MDEKSYTLGHYSSMKRPPWNRRICQLCYNSFQITPLAYIDSEGKRDGMTTPFNISQRLKLLISLALIVVVLSAVVVSSHMIEQLRQAESLRDQISSIQKITTIIHDLQIERGQSSGFLGSGGTVFKEELALQRIATDSSVISSGSIRLYASADDSLHTKLERLRRDIDRQTISPADAFDTYTQLISAMRSDYLAQVVTVRHFQMRNHLQAYTNLMATKEALGQMRGAMAAITGRHTLDKEMYLRIAHAKAEFDIAQDRFRVMAAPSMKNRYDEIFNSTDFSLLFSIVNDFLAHPATENLMSAHEWFNLATGSIDAIHAIEHQYIDSFTQIVDRELATAYNGLIFGAAIFLLLIAVILLLGSRIIQSIEKNLKLLDEYKNAVDRSSIVSKTNARGIITYVNDQFCEISGFSRDELIGNSHSIVRHPEMPPEAFREMWSTIRDKRPWSGIIKNRKKDGSTYWVDATINPILDNNDNVEEFIAIRNDITDTILLHEKLERTQQDMIFRIGEVGETRSRETGYHVRRVAEYSRILATRYGLSDEEVRYLTQASPMHDIGKIGIPDTILLKQGPLDQAEWETMRTHSEIGYRFFKDSDSPLLMAAAIITHEHHEKWDGTGYPRGIKGEDIHIYGRITALADVFDALGSDRCYKKAWENEKIFDYFLEQRGKHFDPALVDIFFKHLDEFLTIQLRYAERVEN